MQLVGVDVGGTFTDIVFADTERSRTLIHKVPTSADDPSRAALEGIGALFLREGIEANGVDAVFHGTTIATNAVLENDGARTGMIVNRGYRDILHIGRHQRPQNYSIMQDIPWQARPLVRRRHRKTVGGRLAPPRGEELEPLDEEGVRRAARALRAEGIEAVAVCFLFSYIDPRHEARAKRIVAEEHPGAFVTTSAEVAPQFREFERFTTAAMNAFVGPKVRDYIDRFSRGLGELGLGCALRVMGSNGGVATASMVAERPVLTLLSGPAAGVLGGAWTAAGCGRDRVITFDVGGTSADIGIVADGRFSRATARDTSIAGFPLLVPMIDITTIGAGGGSLAAVDSGGGFRVGPRSAGSRPGPAAYGLGGRRPTVTDANLVLGRLDPDRFLGGDMRLDEGAARRAIDGLAAGLGLDRAAAAEGAITIVNANMANAIRARTVQKGLDPRGFSLVAFGGAGPLHGAEVAAMLEIPEVIVPPFPGATSAAGLLTTDLRYDALKTAFQVEGGVDLDTLNTDFERLEAELLARFAGDGVPPGEPRLARAGDLRYVGQGYELGIDMPGGPLDEAALDGVWAAFHRRHEAEYGHAFPASPIEIVNIRLAGRVPIPRLAGIETAAAGAPEPALLRRGACVFRVGPRLETLETAYYTRDRLPAGWAAAGPAVVLQRDATTLVPPDWRARLVAGGSLVMTRRAGP